MKSLYCAITALILGASFTVSRSLLDYPLLTGQAIRYAVAALALFALAPLIDAALSRHTTRRARVSGSSDVEVKPATTPVTPRRLARLAAVAGTGLVAFNVLLMIALRHADPGVVGTIVGVSPLLLALFGPLLDRQRPALRLVSAAGVVVLGAALVEGGGDAEPIGVLAAAGVLAMEASFSLLAAPLLPALGPVRVSAWSCALAVPMLAVGAVVAGERPRLPTADEGLALAFLGLVMTVIAFVLWYAGVSALGVARAGVFLGLVPVAALATAAVADRVAPTWQEWAGVLLVMAGLVAGLRQRRTVVAPAAAPA